MKKNGEEYIEGNFVRKCADYGQGKIIGCYVSYENYTFEFHKDYLG